MVPLLWVDDDQDRFPAVRYRLTRLGALIYPAYTVAQGWEWLKENEGAGLGCMIVDLLLPYGRSDPDSKLPVPRNALAIDYPGLSLLEWFPAIRPRAIVLSCVSLATLRLTEQSAFDDLELNSQRYFEKLQLGADKEDELGEVVDGILRGKAAPL